MEEEKRTTGMAMEGRRGGTKRKIALDKKREKESIIEVTFSKRRKTLLRKAEKLFQVLPQSSHPVSVAAIVFSPHGKPYIFGSHADPDSLFDSFLRSTNHHHHQAITCVDDHHDPFIIRPPPPSPWPSSYDSSSSCSTGSGSGGTVPSFGIPMQMQMEMNAKYNPNTTTKEWLSLEGCDTLDKMVAKRDHLLTILQLIQQRMSDSSSPASSTATPPTLLVVPPIQTVVTNPTDHGLITYMGEELPSQTADSTASTATTTEDGTTTTTAPGHVEEDSDHPDDF